MRCNEMLAGTTPRNQGCKRDVRSIPSTPKKARSCSVVGGGLVEMRRRLCPRHKQKQTDVITGYDVGRPDARGGRVLPMKTSSRVQPRGFATSTGKLECASHLRIADGDGGGQWLKAGSSTMWATTVAAVHVGEGDRCLQPVQHLRRGGGVLVIHVAIERSVMRFSPIFYQPTPSSLTLPRVAKFLCQSHLVFQSVRSDPIDPAPHVSVSTAPAQQSVMGRPAGEAELVCSRHEPGDYGSASRSVQTQRPRWVNAGGVGWQLADFKSAQKSAQKSAEKVAIGQRDVEDERLLRIRRRAYLQRCFCFIVCVRQPRRKVRGSMWHNACSRLCWRFTSAREEGVGCSPSNKQE